MSIVHLYDPLLFHELMNVPFPGNSNRGCSLTSPGQSLFTSPHFSHTWEQEEVLFHNMGRDTAKSKKCYAKLESCCLVARENGFEYIWDDTCCIDKTSSSELSEAINSMYRYYQRPASVTCTSQIFLPSLKSRIVDDSPEVGHYKSSLHQVQ